MPLRIRRGAFGAAVFLLAVSGSVGGTLWYSQDSRSTHSAGTSAVVGAFPGVDFQQGEANYATSQGQIWTDLQLLPSYAGLQILRSGIEVDLVGPPTDAIRAMVAREGPRYQGKPIPFSYRSVRHSERQLQVIDDRIEADLGYWQQQGIQLTNFGIDLDSNTVQFTLAHYSKANRDALLARYGGSDWVSVLPHDVAPSGF
jgi:hypothetical protein